MNQVFRLVALTALIHVALGAARLDTALSALHLGVSPALVGVLMAVYGVVSIFLAVPAGRWVDRLGVRPFLIGAPLLVVAGELVAWRWHSLPALFVTALMIGTAWGLFYVAQQHLLGQIGGPEQRLFNFTASSTVFGATNFLSPTIAGFVIDRLGDVDTFLAFAILPVFAWLGFAGGVVRFPPASPAAARRPSGGALRSALSLLALPAFRQLYLTGLYTQIVNYAFMFLVPVHAHARGWDASTTGVILGTYAIGILAIRSVTTLLARRFTPWQLIFVAMGLGVAALGGVLAFEALPLQMLCGAGLGASIGLSYPLSIVLMHDSVPEERIGEVVGLRVSLLYTTQALAPLLAGVASAVLGVSGTFVALIGLFAAAGWVARDRWDWTPPRALSAAPDNRKS